MTLLLKMKWYALNKKICPIFKQVHLHILVMKKYKLAVESYGEDSRKGKVPEDDSLRKMCLPQNQDQQLTVADK